MGGRGVDGRDVQHALANATAVNWQGADLIIAGPTIDGEELQVIARVDGDYVYVSNVLL